MYLHVYKQNNAHNVSLSLEQYGSIGSNDTTVCVVLLALATPPQTLFTPMYQIRHVHVYAFN